jgi:hypothetical protein
MIDGRNENISEEHRNKYGLGTIRNLSSGCKTFLNIVKHPDNVVNVEECGPNVLRIIFTMDNIKIFMSRPTLFDYLQDLKTDVFSELNTSSKIDIYRRNLQRNFVENLISKVNSANKVIVIGASRLGGSENSDVKALVRGTLREIRDQASKASSQYADSVTKYHLEDLVYRIDKALEIK